MNNKQRPPKIEIDINKLPIHTCSKCHNTAFIEATEIRVMSLLLSPTGKTEVIKVPVAVYSMCGRKVLNGDFEKKVIGTTEEGSNGKSH